ncbi:MAG: methyltransferase domain-containing protein [Candidatus Hodarchaeota archaeon]
MEKGADAYNPYRLSHEIVSPMFSRLSYSLRRYYVDEFHERNIRMFPKSANVLDIGGKKVKKRGQFNIENHLVKVKYANIDPNTNPDYLCDGSNIPVKNNSFDVIICSELLEHVREPSLILKEAYRILKPGAVLLICVPFLFRIHSDPYDYGRYTDYYWRTVLKEIGFARITIEKQGLYYSVFMDMLKLYASHKQKGKKPLPKILKWLLQRTIVFGEKKALELEKRENIKNDSFLNSFTTGFGIIAIKGT